MENTVKIPSFLHEIHGEQSNWFDITATHLVALFTVIAALFTANDLNLATWQTALLILLAYDLGGGVLANFTYSTKWYYDQSQTRRLVFLSLHFLQPLLMCLVFPVHWIGVALFSAYTVTASFMTNAIRFPQKQLTIGAILSLTGIIALHSLDIGLPTTILLLLTLFLLKLPLSFSVRWYRLEKFRSK